MLIFHFLSQLLLFFFLEFNKTKDFDLNFCNSFNLMPFISNKYPSLEIMLLFGNLIAYSTSLSLSIESNASLIMFDISFIPPAKFGRSMLSISAFSGSAMNAGNSLIFFNLNIFEHIVFKMHLFFLFSGRTKDKLGDLLGVTVVIKDG